MFLYICCTSLVSLLSFPVISIFTYISTSLLKTYVLCLILLTSFLVTASYSLLCCMLLSFHLIVSASLLLYTQLSTSSHNPNHKLDCCLCTSAILCQYNWSQRFEIIPGDYLMELVKLFQQCTKLPSRQTLGFEESNLIEFYSFDVISFNKWDSKRTFPLCCWHSIFQSTVHRLLSSSLIVLFLTVTLCSPITFFLLNCICSCALLILYSSSHCPHPFSSSIWFIHLRSSSNFSNDTFPPSSHFLPTFYSSFSYLPLSQACLFALD